MQKSIRDLTVDYAREHSSDELVSIPVVKLQNYSSSYPVHCTVEDIRENLELEEKETLQPKLESLKLKKQDVLTTLSKHNLTSQPGIKSAARGLNDLLFPLIFTGEDSEYKCSCQNCHNRCCKERRAGKCNINKGYKTVAERAKADFKRKWEEVLNKLEPNNPDSNFCLIEEFRKESTNDFKQRSKES